MAEFLFSSPKKFTVSELTHSISLVLERSFEEICIEGEIGNHRKQASGHQYFTLKDEGAQIACVLFARAAARQPNLREGMQVILRGKLAVYEARGQYQIIVNSVQAAGGGLLAARFEALKARLNAEGLFDAAHKKPLPKFPKRIGIITSPTGAAIRDMLNVLHRRAPWAEIVIYPTRVQGEGAATEMATALNAWNVPGSRLARPDVILLGRGGGSAEDLWEFNEEILARAISASQIPIVSAVGHEIDFTISDFVADLRAPTPSAAAELVVPDTRELLRWLQQRAFSLQRNIEENLRAERDRFARFSRSALFREPQRWIEQWRQQVDGASEAMERCESLQIERARRQVESLMARLRENRPDALILMRRHALEANCERLEHARAQYFERLRQRINRTESLLRALAPEATLARGFSITMDEQGRALTSRKNLKTGMRLRTRLADGEVTSSVE